MQLKIAFFSAREYVGNSNLCVSGCARIVCVLFSFVCSLIALTEGAELCVWFSE